MSLKEPSLREPSTGSKGVLLQVDCLGYAYGDRIAVKDVSFDIREGEIFGFLGPNGAGKTTTISCLSGLLSCWTGSVHFRGAPFRPADATSDRLRLGTVPQELALYEDLTGRENLLFFGRLNGLSGQGLRESVDRSLVLAGLLDRAGDKVGSYSGGMKRRLNLAAGTLHQPDLLLLDEPTVGVDPQSRNHIFDALTALRDSGKTLLYTTHYMEEAERLCNRIAVINEGELAAIGSPNELAVQVGKPEADLEEVFLLLTGRSLRDG